MPREPPGPTQTSPGTSRGPPQGRFLRLFSRQKMFLLLRPLELVVEIVLVMVTEVVVTLSYT